MSFETTSNMVAQVRRILDDNPYRDSITEDIAIGETDWSVTTPANWPTGSVWDADDGTNEKIYVVTGGANPLTVKKGWDNTSDTVHSNGAYFRKEPRFTYDQINDALTRTVNDLNRYVYDVRVTSHTPSASAVWYEMDADFLGIVSATQKSTATIEDQYGYGGKGRLQIIPGFDLATSIATTRKGVKFPDGFYNLTNDVDVFYRASLSTSTIPTGIAADCVAWGAAAYLIGGKAAPKSSPDTDRADSQVPGSALSRSYSILRQRFEDLRSQWRKELLATYPPARVYRT